jgi:hypothetical protein
MRRGEWEAGQVFQAEGTECLQKTRGIVRFFLWLGKLYEGEEWVKNEMRAGTCPPARLVWNALRNGADLAQICNFRKFS